MGYKGKRVRVRKYKFGTTELIKEVKGKCVMSDQGNWLGLNRWFHIRGDEGELHIFGGSDNFTIEIIKETK